ncbi:MAG: hypothetical protein AMXMBFR44_4730 [Candidatus Campbellbacteria bacterium]
MRKILITLGVVIILLVAGFFMFKNKDAAEPETSVDIQEGQTLTDEDVQEIIQMVGRHIQLPDEMPEVGVVTDIEILRSTQPFYANAENGNVLLLYPSISRAILFDPDQDVIINVGPIVFENPEGGPTE